MATYFARGIITGDCSVSVRLPGWCHNEARTLPPHRLGRYLASRGLLAELLFTLYGVSELPEIICLADGRPVFADGRLPGFSLAYAGNIVGVAMTTEGRCGLDMALQQVAGRGLSPGYAFSEKENVWINNQHDADEARAQLLTLRRSVLKLTGNLRRNDPRDLLLLPASGRLRAANAPQIEAICDAEDILLWSVAASPAIENLVIQQYHAGQGWRSLPDAATRARSTGTRLMRFTSLADTIVKGSDAGS